MFTALLGGKWCTWTDLRDNLSLLEAVNLLELHLVQILNEQTANEYYSKKAEQR